MYKHYIITRRHFNKKSINSYEFLIWSIKKTFLINISRILNKLCFPDFKNVIWKYLFEYFVDFLWYEWQFLIECLWYRSSINNGFFCSIWVLVGGFVMSANGIRMVWFKKYIKKCLLMPRYKYNNEWKIFKLGFEPEDMKTNFSNINVLLGWWKFWKCPFRGSHI